MESSARLPVLAERHMNASAEKVYDAWLDPENVGKWLFTTPSGKMQSVAIDPVVGGKFSIIERRDDDEVEHLGEYLALERPTQIIFDVTVPHFSSSVTHVEVNIKPSPDGGCDVAILHDGVFQDFARRTVIGWVQTMADLDALLAKQA
jgi:uncharacterized protein YndB with AHSA1/START domain